MDPVINPYTPGAGSRPPELTGRDKQIADFSILIKRMYLGKPQKSLIITGLRGVGKTVLLNTFQDIAESQGLKTAKIEITHETQFKVAIARQVRSIILSLSAIGKMKELSKKALGVLKAFTIKNAEGLELNIDVEAIHGIADSGDLETDISDLFSAAAKAAREHNTGIVFLIDEIQFLDKSSLEALISALHQTTQQNLPITLVGAGLPNLPALTGEAKSYAERLFQYPKIGKLNDQESKLALIIPAKKEGVDYDDDAVKAILDFTEGFPYFLQEYGQHVWNIATDNKITIDDVTQSKKIVLNTLDESFFQVRIARSTEGEIRYMSAMSSLGKGPYRSQLIAEKMKRKIESISPIRSTLIGKGLVYSPSYGLTNFTVPQYDDYMRRIHPFTKVGKNS